MGGIDLSPKLRQKTTAAAAAEGMGLLFVFFPDDADEDHDITTPTTTTTPPPHASKLLSRSPSPSPSSAAKSLTGSASRRTSSSSTRLLTKAQSTISICALLVFITLLVFTLSTFEPSAAAAAARTHLPATSRRFLSQTDIRRRSGSPTSNMFSSFWSSGEHGGKPKHQFALQGMGTLYRRGTRAMNDLIVGHVAETTSDEDIRVFMRAIHRSGSTAKADVVLILGSPSSANLSSVVREENDSFSKLLERRFNGSSSPASSSSRFDVSLFVKSAKSKEKEVAEPIWGKKSRSNYSDGGESIPVNYGSVVSFDAADLDPENSLAGFLDHVPMSLRRWACYPMLLGRLRRNFKHVMLVDVKSAVVLSDPLGRVRSRAAESVQILIRSDGGGKHGKKSSDKNPPHSSVNSAVIIGGARGVRRLAAAMLTEIVRAAMQHKKKSSVTESGVLSQLVGNEFMLKNVDLIRAAESAPELSSFAAGAASPVPDYAVVHRGISRRDLNALIMKQICLHEYDSSSVYKDC